MKASRLTLLIIIIIIIIQVSEVKTRVSWEVKKSVFLCSLPNAKDIVILVPFLVLLYSGPSSGMSINPY